jgi:hypothetical protein
MSSFYYLFVLFNPVFDVYTPFAGGNEYIVKKVNKRGRPFFITRVGCLVLVLVWSCTLGSLIVRQLLFGMTMSPICKYQQFAWRILIMIFKNNELAKICLSLIENLEQYRMTIEERRPTLSNVWGAMDGLNCQIDQAVVEMVQS